VSDARAALRAGVFLRALVPLLEVVIIEQPAMARAFAHVDASVGISAGAGVDPVRLVFRDGRLKVGPGGEESDLECAFKDVTSLNAFFGGAMMLPHVAGALRHPLLLTRVVRLFASLRMLEPGDPPSDPTARALRVKVLLYLVTRALAELHHGGHQEMRKLVDNSPDRVYQWSVEEGGIGAWLRMCEGKVMAGCGLCDAREPFVHFVFPTVDAALAVLTATGSQVDGVRDGLIRVIGSPEYSRKISLLMQQVDELLVEG
jgi:hypothetical protein